MILINTSTHTYKSIKIIFVPVKDCLYYILRVSRWLKWNHIYNTTDNHTCDLPDFNSMDVQNNSILFIDNTYNNKDYINRITKNNTTVIINNINLVEVRIDRPLDGMLVKIITAIECKNINRTNMPIYITRHGESYGQLEKIIGGNSNLTTRGVAYSVRLKKYLDDRHILNSKEQKNKIQIMCSNLNRSIQTGNVFLDDVSYSVSHNTHLNEINGGIFENISVPDIMENYSEIYNQRLKNKYTYAWPDGESYIMMIRRMENVFLSIESHNVPMLIIGHQAVCRGLYAYLLNIDLQNVVDLEIESHRVFEFVYNDTSHRYTVISYLV